MKYYPPRYLFRRYELLRRIRPSSSFLEIGPGNLYLTVDILSYFQRGTVVEYNPEIRALFESLPETVRSRIDFIVGDFLKLDIEETFNCAVACEVLEHVADEHLFLKRTRELLAPGGQLLLSVPAKMQFWSVHDDIVGHLRRYEKNQLGKLLEVHGYTNISVISYGYPFVNLLRLLRVINAHRISDVRKSWDQVKQTQESGLAGTTSPASKLFGLFANPATAYPFNIIASFFNRFDLSNGYLVSADRND